MSILTPSQVTGNQVTLLTNNPRHIGAAIGSAIPQTPGSASSPESGFADVLMKALESVNDDQLKVGDLTEQLITSPDTVNVHDISIALAQANLSLSMTKAVVDRAIRAYQEIVALR